MLTSERPCVDDVLFNLCIKRLCCSKIPQGVVIEGRQSANMVDIAENDTTDDEGTSNARKNVQNIQ